MKPKVTWVLVADGAVAKVFAWGGPDEGLTPVDGLMFEQERLRARDINSDRPGREHASAGTHRSAMEPATDLVEMREARFVRQVIDVLAERHREGAFDRLVIAAAPTALGAIRPHIGKDLAAAIVAELPKDLTRSPTEKLEAQLRDVLVPSALR